MLYTGMLAHNQYSALHHKNRCVPLAYQVLKFARVWRFLIADSRHRKRAAARARWASHRCESSNKNVINSISKDT